MEILFYSLILIFFLLEYLIPYRKGWLTSKKQFLQFPFYFIISMFLIPVLQILLASVTLRLDLFSKLPIFPGVIVAFIIGEFFYYWYHRLEHTIPFLWKIHVVHHNQHSVNLVNFWFAHPIELALNFLVTNLPLVLLGFRFEVLAIHLMFVSLLYMFSHLNVNIKLGPFKYLIGNPELHRFHHSTVLEEAKNYCGRLPLWDIIFRTFYYEDKDGPDVVGVLNEQQYPSTVIGNTLLPFRSVWNSLSQRFKSSSVSN